MSPSVLPAVPLHEAEREAVEKLSGELAEPLAFAVNAFNLTVALLASVPEAPMRDLPPSLHVGTQLLLRLSNDIRCVETLVRYGYPAQALSLVASMYEVAFTVGYIGPDDSLAQEWLKHDDPARSFRKVRTMTEETFTRLRRPAVEADAAYRAYQQVCMVKHANPVFMSRFGIDVEGEQVVSGNGPMTSEGAIRAGWIALHQAGAIAAIAVSVSLNSSLGRLSHNLVRQQLFHLTDELWAELARVDAGIAERWGDEARLE